MRFLNNEYLHNSMTQGEKLVYGQDLDFKSEVKKFVKSAKSFKISEAKKLIINTDKLEVAANNYHSYIP